MKELKSTLKIQTQNIDKLTAEELAVVKKAEVLDDVSVIILGREYIVSNVSIKMFGQGSKGCGLDNIELELSPCLVSIQTKG